jgi:hypothetical protein
MRDCCSSAVQAIRSPVTSGVQAEHNRLFHRQSDAGKRLEHSRKRPKKWTHRFICLGSNTVGRWISADRLDLELAGLGERNRVSRL